MSESITNSSRPFCRSRLTFGAITAIVVAIIAANSSGRSSPIGIKLPVPNGYDDLEVAGSRIQGAWPNQGDLARADVGEIRTFLEANRSVLDLARVGLGRESMVPLENSQAGLNRHFEALSRVRGVGRLLVGESIVAQSEGRVIDSVRSARDLFNLGQAMTRGGMGNDVAVGWMLQGQAIAQIRTIRDSLSSPDCRTILRELEALDGRREPLAAVHDRWAAWYGGTYNSIQRMMFRLSGVEKSGEQAELAIAKKSRDQIERAMRFFLVELAIHAHHLDRGTWPRTVQELVPAYLASVPIDPATGKPLDYPANPQGELTDDLNSIARPDGEVGSKP